jgi:hypothetical protein
MKKILKKIFIKFNSLINLFGLDLYKIINLFFIPRYVRDLINFKKMNGKINSIFPVLGEHTQESSNLNSHYFQQDLIVAQYIFNDKPILHVDIGSRIDGFVSHVASFRKIEVFDIRNNKIKINNILFNKLDLQNEFDTKFLNYTDSLSCLHTIEHIGLGRYGDRIDPHGYLIAYNNLIKILAPGGKLYISFPISEKMNVYFNAHRTFSPKEILTWSNEVELLNFDYIDEKGSLHLKIDLNNEKFSNLEYGCGIYTFKKLIKL